jgi:hypothetical protein
MFYLKKSKNIFVSLLFSGSVNSNLYCGCCPCNKNEKNNNPSEGTDNQEKDKDKKDKEKDKEKEQNENVINDLEGVVGLTCKLENNKVCLYTKVPNNDNYKFAESTEEFKSEFKYEKFKYLRINIKIDEFGIKWEDDCTIEKQIEFFKENLDNVKSFEFLSNKIIFFTGGDNGETDYVYDLSDMKVYEIGEIEGGTSYCQNVDFSNPGDLKLKDYGILSNEKYFKQDGKDTIDFADENQAEYKKAFWEGK